MLTYRLINISWGDIILLKSNSIFKENRSLYYIILIIWLSASLAGVICAFTLSGDVFPDISAYVKETMEDGISVQSYIKIDVKENAKFLFALIISSCAPVFLPVVFALAAFKGFSIGFTSSFIIRLYSFKGALVCFGAVILPYAFSLPVIFAMILSSVRFSLKKRNERSFGERKTGEWISYIIKQSLFASLLCLIGTVEAFISKFLIELVR